MNRIPRFIAGAWCSCALLLTVGCAARLPVYPAMSDEESLRIVAERMASIASISSGARLAMTNAQGETVSFDAALVAEPPRRARLRAWKFGSPVMDLTILPEGVWAYVASRNGDDAHGSLDPASLPAAGLTRAVEMLSGAFFESAEPLPAESTGATLVVAGPALGVGGVRCEIDRSTLTPRRFIIDEGSAHAMDFILDRYALIDGVAWPRRWIFTAPEGRITLRLFDVELNVRPPDSAFAPPARAARLP